MPQGLQLFDVSGNRTLDVTDRITRYLGSFQTGTDNGSFSDQRLSQGVPFYQIVSEGEIGAVNFPSIMLSGTTFRWEFFTTGLYAPRTNSTVYYGVY